MTGIMATLLGSGTSAVINFVDHTIYSFATSGAAVSSYQVKSDGFDYSVSTSAGTVTTQWITPVDFASAYEVYATLSSGTLGSGTTGSWLAVTSNPLWTVTKGGTTSGINTATLSMQVRAISTTTVLDTWTITLTAEK